MAYIGNTADQQAFTPAIDFFSGNGVTTAFTLSRPVASVAQVQATIENVPQNPGTAFTVSGNTITFDGAPASGTNNIYVYYTSPITQVIQPGQGTVGTAQLQSGVITPTAVSDQLNSSTGYFDLPTGTTAQRPASPVNGMVRYNTTNQEFEVYQNGSWRALTTQTTGIYSVDYLIVAGGASGGAWLAGGGGAGGYIASTATVSVSTAYSLVVGAGGAAKVNAGQGINGSNSTGFSQTAIGGGGGGNYGAPTGTSGISGGSGGGGGVSENGTAPSGGAGTSGQGNAGGNGFNRGGAGAYNGGGGGGGAGAAGQTPSSINGGNGGNGLNWQSLGTFYAGGGGGAGGNSGGIGGSGGSGGGGKGADSNTANQTAGGVNTGGGGGASRDESPSISGAGGSGIVIVRYAGAQKGTGGTVTSAGGFTYHTFTSSGTFTA